MPLRFTFFLFLLIFGNLLAAQDLSLSQKVERIDSLILYSNLSEATKEADLLYDELSRGSYGNNHMDVKLAVMLLKANIYGLQEDNTRTISLLLTAIDLAREYHLPKREYRACLLTALVYEVSGDFDLCRAYLNKACEVYAANNLKQLYSTYCIRSSSYYRLTGMRDSALHYAYEALRYTQQYPNRRDLADAYLMLSILLNKIDSEESIKFASLAANEFMERNDYPGVAAMHGNICRSYQTQKAYGKAFLHNDTALMLIKKFDLPNSIYSIALKHRQELFDSTGNRDSAYTYFKAYHQSHLESLKDQETTEIRRITETYQDDKRETLIKSKDQQLFFIIVLLAVIATASALVLRKNRKINQQNKLIRKQIEELVKMLEQKELLLSELQHRVKNNLQHVISILEIQKESVNFNNIEELIRGNQNRIHSIALLHKKLNSTESVNEVSFDNYIFELSELVKSSYDIRREKVRLDAQCEIQTMSIEKALPLGLIIVELVSNSMKHAFRKKHTGTIRIFLSRNEETGEGKLFYSDNGHGFDFSKQSKKGLGMEIMKGLIEQLDGRVESTASNGFALTVYFK